MRVSTIHKFARFRDFFHGKTFVALTNFESSSRNRIEIYGAFLANKIWATSLKTCLRGPALLGQNSSGTNVAATNAQKAALKWSSNFPPLSAMISK